MNIDSAIKFAASVTKAHLDFFRDCFPSEQSKNYVYYKFDNVSWTTGFYTGILWILYELTSDAAFKSAAELHDKYMKDRIDNNIEMDHHDLGFLYSLSSVAEYKLTGDEEAKKTGIKAADMLLKRYHPNGGFIQAWGAMDDPSCYRFIIDCLLNLPLLYWASEVTGDTKYKNAAIKHTETAVKYVVRDDYSTHHTYFMKPGTDIGDHGETHQGFSDSSAWARGQAWGVYGLAIAYAYTKDKNIVKQYNNVTKYFIENLPKDSIPYWDLCFKDGSKEPRDTSAAAIAACGIMEMNKYIPNPEFMKTAEKIMTELSENYTTKNIPKSNGILTDAMYSRKAGHEPECNIWGDYFYVEGLMRIKNPSWIMYW